MKKVLLGLVALVLVGLAVRAVWTSVGEEDVPANYRAYMDKDTGEVFKLSLDELGDEGYPYTNPKTGEKTLYPTEVCWANQCGNSGGTHVIMNTYLGKEEPTYCPKCGALVRFHNPGPTNNKEESN